MAIPATLTKRTTFNAINLIGGKHLIDNDSLVRLSYLLPVLLHLY